MMTPETNQRGIKVLSVFMDAHAKIYADCVSRWEAWRPADYLSELRRVYLSYRPNDLSIPVLNDPVFFFRCIQNTRIEVFPELRDHRQLSIPRILAIRNAAAHDGIVKLKKSDTEYDHHQLNDDDVLYLTDCCARLVDVITKGTKPATAPKSPPVTKPRKPRDVVPTAPPPVPPSVPSTSARDIEGLPQVLSFYILCDVSTSMHGPGIDAVNKSIEEMHAQLLEDPVISDKVRLAMLTFSSQAQVELSLKRPSEIATMPQLSASGVTNYSRALELVSHEIETDIAALSSTHRPLRPVVFIISDGDPTDKTWIQGFDKLVDSSNPYAPRVVIFPCGFETSVLSSGFAQLTKGPAPHIWPIDPNRALEDAVREAIHSVTRTIVQTASRADQTLALGD